jgi:hypothetical protein
MYLHFMESFRSWSSSFSKSTSDSSSRSPEFELKNTRGKIPLEKILECYMEKIMECYMRGERAEKD